MEEDKMEIISKTHTLEAFALLKHLKGRRRYVVGLIGMGLGYMISNNEIIAILSGLVFDSALGLIEYYLNEYVN